MNCTVIKNINCKSTLNSKSLETRYKKASQKLFLCNANKVFAQLISFEDKIDKVIIIIKTFFLMRQDFFFNKPPNKKSEKVHEEI